MDITAIDPSALTLSWAASTAGIVALTILLVQKMKTWLAEAPRLNWIPAWGYVILVSCLLTGVASVAGVLQGAIGQLLAQAFLQAVGAIALFEVGTNLLKPIGASAAARDARLPVLLLILGLATSLTACASVGGKLVAADRAVHAAIAQTQDTANRLCDSHVLTAESCRQFNASLVPVLKDADAFNRAVAADSTAEIPTMAASLVRLSQSVAAILPANPALKSQIDDVVNLLRSLGGK